MPRKRNRIIGIGIIATLFFGTASVAGSTPASAVTCTVGFPAGHYYAIQQEGSDGCETPVYQNQLGADLEVDCLAVLASKMSSEDAFANWEMWLATNDTNATSTSSSGSWLEAGLRDGPIADGNPSGFMWFWADQPPGGTGYNEHKMTNVTAFEGDRKNVTFKYVSGGTWQIFLSGTVEATPTDNAAYSGGTNLGAEVHNDALAQVWGHAWNWQHTNGGSWTPVLPSKQGYYPSTNPVGYTLTATNTPTNESSSRASNVTVKTNGAGQVCGDQPQVAKVNPMTQHGIRSLADVNRVASVVVRKSATGTVLSATTVRTSRSAATALTGSHVRGANSVYFVQEVGNFTIRVPNPAGGYKVNHGHAITMTIDPATGLVLDWGIQAKPSNLRSLGTVSTIAN